MQVANALNNSIRILFNPRVEAFKLFDFLIVKSDSDRYMAQIIEIYDDKFDSSQNVAKIKLFYKIAENNEVMPYDNFTPNRECEIIKIKQEEVETFINNNKKTFIFGTNAKSSTSLNLKYDLFENNCIIMADKVEQANLVSHNLAKNLSSEKNVVVIDSTGIIDFDGAKKIKASKNFKLPLNYTTINYVFQRCLADASLEFQAIGGEILNEIKKFARKQEGEFIPFNAFTRVLLEQYKVTPYVELKLLLSRLKKYQMDEIFARSKKDVDVLFKNIEKNPITILDLSSVDISWQKAYLKYFINDIQQNIYLLARVNDDNCDVDMLNQIYCQKENIKFVPSVSYNYKKLPTIIQYCKNYILLPSLFQRADFLDANFALSNLISDGCVIFGQDTDNFLYLARDYELAMQEQRKNYRKIALTLVEKDEEIAKQNLGEKGDYFEAQQKQEQTHSQKLIEELSNFEKEQLENSKKDSEEVFEEIKNPEEIKKPEENVSTDEFDVLDEKTQEETEEQEIKKEAQDDFQELTETKEEVKEEIKEEPISEVQEETIEETQEEVKDVSELTPEEIQQNVNEIFDVKEEEKTEVKEEKPARDIHEEPLTFAEIFEEEDEEETSEQLQEEIEEKIKIEENKETEITKEEIQEEEIDISDEELDFFQLAKDSSFEEETSEQPQEITSSEEEIKEEEKEPEENKEETTSKEEENIIVDDIKYKTSNTEDDEDINLSEAATNSIDNNFNEIINSKPQQTSQTITIDENTKINLDKLETSSSEELPIFKEENEEEIQQYAMGDVVIHQTYYNSPRLITGYYC